MAALKTCFKCGKEKKRTEFYKHPQMGDGLLGKCKECTKADSRKHRAENLDALREYDRVRARQPHRIQLSLRVQKEYRAAKDRYRANGMVAKAVRDGRLKPQPCWVCGAKAVAHHPDYSRPLDVVWLCSDYENGWTRMWKNDAFPNAAPEIEDRARYHSEESMQFRAGSYGGYNEWRNSLAAMVGTTPKTAWAGEYQGPFAELINFSDCEGVIGATVCRKLAEDFKAQQTKADTWDDEWFRERYALWRQAFEMGADNGAVSFH
jgi:hypothetical protein